MNLQEIEKLIGKYENGETTLQEEEILRSYFSGSDIPPHIAVYREVFDFYETASQETLPDENFDDKLLNKLGIDQEPESKPGKIKRMYTLVSIAASFILLLSFYFILQNQKHDMGTYDDPQMAYAEAKKVLMKVSGNLNAGMKELSNVDKLKSGVNELQHIRSFNDGMQSLERISVFDKSKQIVTQ